MSLFREPSLPTPRGDSSTPDVSPAGASARRDEGLENLRLDPSHNPVLLSASRAALSALRDLELLAKAEIAEGDGRDLAERALEGWRGHPYLAMELQSIREALEGMDLDTVLVQRLTKISGVDESLAALKLCGSADAHSALVNQFVLPYLERRQGLPDQQGNETFASFLLSSLPEKDLVYALDLIDLTKLPAGDDQMKGLAARLLDAVDPEPLMDTLVGKSSARIDGEPAPGRELGQRFAVSLLSEIAGRNPELLRDALVPHMEALYRNSESNSVARPVIDLLAKHNHAAALRVLRDVYSGDATTDDERMKRFFSVGHLSIVHSKHDVPAVFEDMALSETDPYVCGNVAYVMAHEAGPEGRLSLAAAISRQISNREASLPLATIASLSAIGYGYSDIVRTVLSSGLEDGSVLAAFSKLEGEPLSKAGKSDRGATFFKLSSAEDPELSADLVAGIGINTLLEWTMDQNEPLRRGSRELLEAACRFAPERSRALISMALAEPGPEGERARRAFEALSGWQAT